MNPLFHLLGCNNNHVQSGFDIGLKVHHGGGTKNNYVVEAMQSVTGRIHSKYKSCISYRGVVSGAGPIITFGQVVG